MNLHFADLLFLQYDVISIFKDNHIYRICNSLFKCYKTINLGATNSYSE